MIGLAKVARGAALGLALAAVALGCGGHHSAFNDSPALSVTSFTIDSPQLVKGGQTVTYHDTVSNSGNASSDSLTYQLYLSNVQITLDNFAGGSVVPLGSLHSIGTIGANSESSENVSFTVPQPGNGPIQSGAGYVALVVNSTPSSAAIISANVPVTIH